MPISQLSQQDHCLDNTCLIWGMSEDTFSMSPYVFLLYLSLS